MLKDIKLIGRNQISLKLKIKWAVNFDHPTAVLLYKLQGGILHIPIFFWNNIRYSQDK
jgi:hypothetical protein